MRIEYKAIGLLFPTGIHARGASVEGRIRAPLLQYVTETLRTTSTLTSIALIKQKICVQSAIDPIRLILRLFRILNFSSNRLSQPTATTH